MAYYYNHMYLWLLLACMIYMAMPATIPKEGSCGRCEYYDPDIDQCTDCSIACTPAKDHCQRVCQDWPDCQSTSPQWPWIVIPFMVLLAFLFIGACCFWKHCGGGKNTNVCWRQRKDEEVPSVVPLMTTRDDVPPHRDDVPSQCDAVSPQCDPTKGPCDHRHPMAFSGNDKNCVV